jgi:AcrR family transcriptional regulator
MTRTVFKPHLATAQDARAVRTRETLRRALLELLERASFEQLSVRDIAAAAGIGYATFFRHYTTKESLLQEIAAEQMHNVVNMALPILDMSNRLPASIALFQYVDDHRKLWTSLLTGGAAGAMREEFLKISTDVAARQKNVSAWPPTEISTVLVVSSTIELFALWLRQKNPFSVEEIAEIHERLIITPGVTKFERGAAARALRSASKRRK